MADFFRQNHFALHRLARSYFRHERPSHTLQPTALVNEAFVRLRTGQPPKATDATQCFAIASRTMQRILVEHARHRNAVKRGGKWQRVSLEDAGQIADHEPDSLAVKMAISRLTIRNAALAQIAELCLIDGLSTKEAASILGRGESTIRRDRRRAGDLLREELLGVHQ
jgi:RNA polymerase sigma factor (TIGR02999 family)